MITTLAAVLLAGLSAAAPAPSRPRGVVLISVDALRADRLGARHNGVALTPRLDAWAARGIVFEQAVSQAPWTLPSMMTAFTSVYPHRHGVTNRFESFDRERREPSRLPRSMTTLAEAFKNAGWDTAAFTGEAGLERVHGFDRGFDVYYDSITFAGFETTAPLALEWLKARGPRPFFLFLHGYDVHGENPLPPGFKSRFDPLDDPDRLGRVGDEYLELRLAAIEGRRGPASARDKEFWRAVYDERVARADERLGRFLTELEAMPGFSTGVVVAVMSDHGEELLERGGVDHGMTLYDEVLRTALIVRAPDLVPRRVKAQARLLDLAATLLDLAGVSDARFSAQAQGVSLRPLMEGRPLALDSLAETDYLFRASLRALRTSDGRKLVFDLESLERRLYDLRADPGETRDLAGQDPGAVKELDARLRRLLDLPSRP